MEGTAGTKYTLWEGQKRRQRICQLTVQNRGSPPGGWATLENESHGKKSKESEHPADVPPRDSFAVQKVLRCSFTHRVIITEGPIEGTVLRQEEMIASERSNFVLVKLPARPTFSIPTKDTKEHSKCGISPFPRSCNTYEFFNTRRTRLVPALGALSRTIAAATRREDSSEVRALCTGC